MNLSDFSRLCGLLYKADIGITNARILATLPSLGHPSMSRIAQKVEVSTAAITCAADRLEALGYAERYHLPNDRRAICLRLTPTGSEFVASIQAFTLT